MPIYANPTKDLMFEFSRELLKPGQLFDKKLATSWFAKKYPKIKPATVEMHVEGMAVNSTIRKHHPSIRLGSGHDLFFKVAPGKFRLWDPVADPAPYYPHIDVDARGVNVETLTNDTPTEPDERGGEEVLGADAFAFERDLRNYLVKNLGAIEPGLTLYQDDGFEGVEFPAGGRYIDILAVGNNGDLVVLELKVSRGYDRVIGQLLRYINWIKLNLAESRRVRGIIVARDVSEDLKMATMGLPDVTLVEYRLSFTLKVINQKQAL